MRYKLTLETESGHQIETWTVAFNEELADGNTFILNDRGARSLGLEICEEIQRADERAGVK